MAFCLTRDKQKKFIEAIRTKRLDPEKLSEMSSAERREIFENEIGDGKDINQLFEQRLLLKNRQNAYIGWVKQLVGLKPEVRRDLISRIEKLDRILSPKEEKDFLADLAEKRLGVGVDTSEAQKILELSQNIKANESKKGDADYDARMEYGRSVVELQNYVDDLKHDARKLRLEDFRARNLPGTLKRGLVATPGTMKSIAASMDASAILRQGWKTLWSQPKIWARNSLKSLEVAAKTLGGKNVMNEVNADIMSRPTYDQIRQAKLDVGTREEAYPTSFPEKIPILGRAFKASEAAYTSFTHLVRADVFDKMVDIAGKNGVELTKPELESIGKMVNSLTGRGSLGKHEATGKTLNVLMFSPKMLKSHIDALTQPFTGAGGSSLVRREAAKSLIRTVIGTAGVMTIASFLGYEVELDPRSADFGKIKRGDTRFDVTGGMGSLVTLASRLLTGKTKSSTSGKMTDLYDAKYGQQNALDVLESFLENKAAPVARVGIDFLKGKDFDGNKMSPLSAASWGRVGLNAVTPLPIKNLVELVNDPKASQDPTFVAVATALDMLGISVNTYSAKKKDKDASIGDKVRAGKLSQDDATTELDRQLKAGEITHKQYKDAQSDMKDSETVKTVKELKFDKPESFTKAEDYLKSLPDENKLEAVGGLMDKRDNMLDDKSVKANQNAEQLKSLITKYLPVEDYFKNQLANVKTTRPDGTARKAEDVEKNKEIIKARAKQWGVELK